MSLKDIVNNERTDKNTVHSYLDLYQNLLVGKKESATNILEVGICYGGSIKLWHDFFVNATVYGLDIIPTEKIWNEIKNNNRIVLHASIDAYDENYVTTTFLNKGTIFDMILDDGPHTLESMKKFIKYYSPLLKDDGILIIEDVQKWDWIDQLKSEVPDRLKKYIQTYDLRENKNRYDDIVFVINKTVYTNEN